MRSFICYECGHRFQVVYGVGGRGSQMACPSCGGRNIHRVDDDKGFNGAACGHGGQGRWPRWGRQWDEVCRLGQPVLTSRNYQGGERNG